MANWSYSDGGQAQYRSLNSGYCGVRALVLAEGMGWKEAEKHLREFTKKGKAGSGKLSGGIFKKDYDAALRALGYEWVAAPKFAGRKAKARDLSGEGTLIARQANHFVCVEDGVVQDIWDCSEKMVYGYWKKDAQC